MNAIETIAYLYGHGYIPQRGHYEIITKEIKQLQAELDKLRRLQEIKCKAFCSYETPDKALEQECWELEQALRAEKEK